MNRIFYVPIIATLLCIPAAANAHPATPIVKALTRYFGKTAGKEAGEQLAKEVPEVLIKRVTTKIVREGGEESIEQVSIMVAKIGPDVLRAIDNAPVSTPILRALDDLPAEQATKAAARLAARETGSELAEATIKHGTKALTSELRHPGIGGQMVRLFGDDGASLCGKLTTDQAITVGRHADDIAKLPVTQRNAVIGMIGEQSDRMCRFIGRFVSDNPGKVLFTGVATTIVLANADKVLGDAELVYDQTGNPILIEKSGLIERLLGPVIGPAAKGVALLVNGVAIIAILFVAAYALIKLRKIWSANKTLSGGENPTAADNLAQESTSHSTDHTTTVE